MTYMKPGCCSAISPCSHQQKHPESLCEICQKSIDDYREHTEKQAIDRAIRILRSHGYTVIDPAPAIPSKER